MSTTIRGPIFNVQVPYYRYPDGPRSFGVRDGWVTLSVETSVERARGVAEAYVYQGRDEARVTDRTGRQYGHCVCGRRTDGSGLRAPKWKAA